ncbi:MAG: NADH dehydrogenase [Roseburia sp.]|jgi:formate hydrogenlyase subunit 3/multisubunit Na+/H+ antiporter MnhD subunit|nr:NADH dehydrogenase [Roseburia sp.]
MEREYLLLVPVLLPFIGAVVSYLIGRRSRMGRNLFAELLVIAECAVCAALFVQAFQAYGTADAGAVSDAVGAASGAALRNAGISVMRFSCAGFGMGLHFILDGFRGLYCLVASFMWMMTGLFSREYFGHYRNRNRYYFFMLLTLGATVGVFLSADLYTTFLFFEIMSFTSYVWVAHDESKEALGSAATYLAVAVTGGLVMLMGLFLLYDLFGTLAFAELPAAAAALRETGAAMPAANGGAAAGIAPMTQLYAAGGCLLFGFGAKAGAFPLHIWLPKAHPVAPAPASALLSGILTKTGVFGVIAATVALFACDGKWGALVLFLGVATMVAGAVLAVFSVNIKRTLACSSVSQIGFILTGVGLIPLLGEEHALAARGTLLHMVNHSLFKLVLFLAAGAVYMRIHKLNINEIRGFGRKKPFLKAVFLLGALGICGVPGGSGYISKTLLHESIVEYRKLLGEGAVSVTGSALTEFLAGETWAGMAEWLFLISGGLTVAYMTKLFVAVFAEKNADAKVQEAYDADTEYMTLRSKIALAGSAAFIVLFGLMPHIFMDPLAEMSAGFFDCQEAGERIAYFSFGNIKGALISLAIGAAVYFGIVRTVLMRQEERTRAYADRWPAWLDLENLVYRPLLLAVLPFVGGVVCRFLDRLLDGIVVLLRRTLYKDSPIPHELEQGTWLTHAVGTFLDNLALVFHQKTNYNHKLAMMHEDLAENGRIIGRSLSFGLFMACVGLILTLVYLLI